MKNVSFVLLLIAIVPTPDGLLLINPTNNAKAVLIDEHPIIILPEEEIMIEGATFIRSGVIEIEMTRKSNFGVIAFFAGSFLLLCGILFLIWRLIYAKQKSLYR